MAALPDNDPQETNEWLHGAARQQGRLGPRRPHRQLRLGATLYDVGFNHFWHAPSDKHGGDLVFFQGHSAPGVYARAFMLGRLTEDQMDNFRQEVDGKGLSSYPHPWLMPDFWQFPTVSMGLGPLQAIYQARFMKYLQDRGLIDTDNRKVWAFLGDGEMDEPESMGAIGMAGAREARQPDLRHQLQPAAARRPGARQRQDHPGTGIRLPRRRLERDQGDLGFLLGPAAGQDKTGLLRSA
jgi:pyruvate dehydrogenase complex dehydrogenase (E1) component